jgi:hypothetical protein
VGTSPNQGGKFVMNHVRIEAWWIGAGEIIPTSTPKFHLDGYVDGLKN